MSIILKLLSGVRYVSLLTTGSNFIDIFVCWSLVGRCPIGNNIKSAYLKFQQQDVDLMEIHKCKCESILYLDLYMLYTFRFPEALNNFLNLFFIL